MLNNISRFQAINTQSVKINTQAVSLPVQTTQSAPAPVTADRVQLSNTQKGIAANTISFSNNTDPYARSTQEAGKILVAMAVLVDGTSSDTDKFELKYSDREFRGMIKDFQSQIGAEVTGIWNEDTYGAAKDFVVEEVLDGDYITDGQFDNFLQDLLNFYNFSISGDEAVENLEGYAYDGLENPIHAPLEADPIGFQNLTQNQAPIDMAMMAMALSAYDSEEAAEVLPLLNGEMNETDARAYLLENYIDEEEFAVIDAAPSFQEGLSRLFVQEMQWELFDDEDQANGIFDQKTYDALREFVKEEYELAGISNADLSKVTNQIMKLGLESIKDGSIESDAFYDKEDAILAPFE